MWIVRKFEVIGDGRRPPVWRSVLLALVAGFFSVVSMAFSPAAWAMQQDNSDLGVVVTMLAFVVIVIAIVASFWRHRIPFLFTISAALLSVVLPIGNTIPFLALAGLFGRRRGPAVWWTTGLVAITSIWVVVADALAQPRGASLQKATFSPVGHNPAETAPASIPITIIFAVLGFGVALGAGILLRSLRDAASARTVASEERATSDRLGDEVARRQERERIAREVHDAMGHRLSLLNLHAGALEANSTDPRVAQSAHLVRTSATAAMDDLRSLLAVLRDPMAFENANVPLSKLPEVVRESFGAGQPLSSSIYIADPERADPALSRGVYRIVQELLTNARRHAPKEQLFLTVEGSPGRGIVIDARNRYAGGRASEAGGSRGLTGITERAELLGGQMTYGLDDGGRTFRVHVELPWREA